MGDGMVAQEIIDAIRQAITDQAPVWDHTFPEGNSGLVVGVPDAAVVAGRYLFEAGLLVDPAEVSRLRQELAEAGDRRIEAIRDLAEGRTVIGAIWHALGIPADADADIVAEVRALVARDKPGCSQAHEELATAEVERDAARQELAEAQNKINEVYAEAANMVADQLTKAGRLQLELDRARPVLDAAKAWRETFAPDILEYAAHELPVVRDLLAAVDTYKAGGTSEAP